MKIRNVNPNFHDSIGCGQKNDAEVTLVLSVVTYCEIVSGFARLRIYWLDRQLIE